MFRHNGIPGAPIERRAAVTTFAQCMLGSVDFIQVMDNTLIKDSQNQISDLVQNIFSQKYFSKKKIETNIFRVQGANTTWS